MKQCPLCGKKKKEFVEGICLYCYIKKNDVVSGFKDIIIEKCDFCGAYKYKDKFLHGDDIINKIVKDCLSFDKNYEIIGLKSKLDKKEVYVYIKAKLGSKVIEREYIFPREIKGITCKKCSKKGTQYFEGILQIRSSNKENIEKAHEFIENDLKNSEKKGYFCSKLVEIKKGKDYFLTSQNYIQELAQKVFNEFGYEIKVNAQLFSRNKQKSKDIFRVNALVNLPNFKKGDTIDINGNILKIKSVKGKFLQAHDLEKDKDVKMELKGKKYDIIADEKNYHETEVVQDKPNVKVLHPINFQAVEPQNKVKLKAGEKVKVLVIGDKVWIV